MKTQDLSILVVDDHAAMRKIMKVQLMRMGFDNVCEAPDGKKAFDILQNKKIGLIISDWNMPEMTGYELLKAVRTDTFLTDTPFIMVTAESSPKYISMALQLKVNQLILKPFTLEVLEEKINQVIH